MELFAEPTIAQPSYDQMFASSAQPTLFSPRIVGGTQMSYDGTIRTAQTGKRVEIIGDEVRIYDSLDQLVATLSGSSIGGLASGLDVTAGQLAIALFTDAGLGGDFYALSTTIDGAVGSDTGDLTISTRLTSGGGEIALVPPVGGRVRAYERFKIVPRASAPSSPQEGDLYVNSTDHKLYIYTGAAWVVVGTQV